MLCHADPDHREQAQEFLWSLELSERADVLNSSPSLRRVQLKQMDLSGIHLPGRALGWSVMVKTRLAGACMHHVVLRQATLTMVDPSRGTSTGQTSGRPV